VILQLKFSYIWAINLLTMGTKEKLVERFKSQPKDFQWNEFVRLFTCLGFELDNKGKTSGSRVIFTKDKYSYVAHKPHPQSIVKSYVMKQAFDFLTKNELI